MPQADISVYASVVEFNLFIFFFFYGFCFFYLIYPFLKNLISSYKFFSFSFFVILILSFYVKSISRYNSISLLKTY